MSSKYNYESTRNSNIKLEEELLHSSNISIEMAAEYLKCATYSKHLEKECENNMPVIISIGSGLGIDEFKLEKKIGKKIICIENKFGDWGVHKDNDIKTYKKPNFTTIEEMLELHKKYLESEKLLTQTELLNVKQLPKKLIDNCFLYISWPYYDEDYNKTLYDIGSIAMLKPISVIIIYGIAGEAGTTTLHSWIHSITNKIPQDYRMYKIPNKKLYPEDTYRVIAKFTSNKKDPRIDYEKVWGMYNIVYKNNNPFRQILYLAKKGTKINKDLKEKLIQTTF